MDPLLALFLTVLLTFTARALNVSNPEFKKYEGLTDSEKKSPANWYNKYGRGRYATWVGPPSKGERFSNAIWFIIIQFGCFLIYPIGLIGNIAWFFMMKDRL